MLKNSLFILILGILLSTPYFSFAQNPSKGFKALDEGDLPKASGVFNKILEKDSENPAALLGMSIVLFRENNTLVDSALKYLKHAESSFQSKDEKEKLKLSEIPLDENIIQSHRDVLESYFFGVASKKLEKLEEFLDRFPSYKNLKMAIGFRDSLAYSVVLKKCENDGAKGQYFKEFIQLYPGAKEVPDAALEMALLSNSIPTLQSFIQKYPEHERLQEAKDKRDELAFAYADSLGTLLAWQHFVETYTDSKKLIDAILKRDTAAFDEASHAALNERIAALDHFINIYGHALQIEDAKILRNETAFRMAMDEHSIAAFRSFMDKYPAASQVHHAAYEIAMLTYTREAIQSFLQHYSQSDYAASARDVLNDILNPTESFDLDLKQSGKLLAGIFITHEGYFVFVENSASKMNNIQLLKISKSGNLVANVSLNISSGADPQNNEMRMAIRQKRADVLLANQDWAFLYKYDYWQKFGRIEGASPGFYKVRMNDLLEEEMQTKNLNDLSVSQSPQEYTLEDEMLGKAVVLYHTLESSKLGIRCISRSKTAFYEFSWLDGMDIGMRLVMKKYLRNETGKFIENELPGILWTTDFGNEYKLENVIRLGGNKILVQLSSTHFSGSTAFNEIDKMTFSQSFQKTYDESEYESEEIIFHVMNTELYKKSRGKNRNVKLKIGKELFFLPHYMDCVEGDHEVFELLIIDPEKKSIQSSLGLAGNGLNIYANQQGGFNAIYPKGPGILGYDNQGELLFSTIEENCNTGDYTSLQISDSSKLFIAGYTTTLQADQESPLIRIHDAKTGSFLTDERFLELNKAGKIEALSKDGDCQVFLINNDGAWSLHKRKW